ncbi:MAG: hypothetical protein HYX75_20575 [Acidobacteria bacterium]|nr:hypothetical protein [Acidobacteriota bacterium]
MDRLRRPAADRSIDCALRRAEIRGDSNIRSPEARQALERAISRRDGNAEWARQVRELSTSQDFRARDEALQERAADRISAHPDVREVGGAQRELANNQGLSDELRQMRADPAFQGLRPPDRQRAVINDMIRFAETPSFREMERQGRGRQALGIIGNLSLHASSTGNAVERNTVDSLASGRTNMDIVDNQTLFHSPDDLALAHPDSNTLVFNGRRANSQSPRDDLAEIAAHEVNHLRNGPTTAGTAERFLDEYRAYWTGRQARGGSGPSAAAIRGQMENLATDQGRGSPYDGTRDRYRSDPGFRNVVDRLVSDANRNPPVLHDPEEVRQLLAAARPRNPGTAGGYLDRPGNVDNHN